MGIFHQFVNEGTYNVSMFSKIKGEITPLSEPQSFEIERIRENILKNPLSPDMNNYIKDLKAFKIKLEPILKEFSSASKN